MIVEIVLMNIDLMISNNNRNNNSDDTQPTDTS
jgi:hypothetical protein